MLLKYPFRAESVDREGAGKNLFLILFFIFLLGFIPLVSAMAAPDTVIVAGQAASGTPSVSDQFHALPQLWKTEWP